MRQGRPSRVVILFQLLLLLLPISKVHGFANYLLSRTQCFTELSTDEAIMNAMVVAASDSTDPTMRIEVVAPDEAEDSTLTIVNDSNDLFHTIVIAKTLPVTLSWRVVSSAIPKNDDYQWVLDVVVPPEADAASSAAFVQGGCEGQWRVAGRGPQDAVALTIREGGNTTLLAAWAASYGPVTLTRPMVVTVRSSAVPKGRGGTVAPRVRAASKAETPASGSVEGMLVLLLLLLAMLLAGGFWWYRIRPRYMKGQRWHL